MGTGNSIPKRGKTGRKLVIYIAVIFSVLALLVFFLLPIFVSSSSGRKTILARINAGIDGEADFADLSMSWFKGIKVKDITFSDNIGRISVWVKQCTTKPHYGSLLTGGLSFGKTVVDEPKVHINLTVKQKEKAEKHDFKVLSLIVLADNEKAQRLYWRCGIHLCPIRQG